MRICSLACVDGGKRSLPVNAAEPSWVAGSSYWSAPLTDLLLSCPAREISTPRLPAKPRSHSKVEQETDMQQQQAQHPCSIQDPAEDDVLLHHHLTLLT